VPSGEKAGRSPLCRRAVRSLWSDLPLNNREIRALFAYFGAERVKILCSSDCVAERAGFEPSVQFCRAKPRYIRKLQIAKPYQRISSKTRHQIFAISPVSIRRPFGHERRTPGDSVAKRVALRGPQAARLGSHVTACLACSHKTESFSGGRNYLRRGFLIVFDFYARALGPLWLHFPQADFSTA
jgi:hypothetical protein